VQVRYSLQRLFAFDEIRTGYIDDGLPRILCHSLNPAHGLGKVSRGAREPVWTENEECACCE
jgi:hypothetical protein